MLPAYVPNSAAAALGGGVPLTVTVPGGMAAGFLVMEKQYGDLLGALRVGVWLE